MYAYKQASEKEAAILGFIAFVVQYKMTGTSAALPTSQRFSLAHEKFYLPVFARKL